ncbi:MAG: SulP family inorganic anion transporter [Aquificae bacterium]|nr:SulP family inorganic anion transporter [Aquificota bacterium]
MLPRSFLRWFRRYDAADLLRDLFVGLTVGAVYVPQAMAYAMLAGVPPVNGLFVAFLATVVAALFGSSRFLNTGPVAMTSLLTASVLYGMGLEPMTEAWVAYASLLAFMVGLLRLGAGLLRLGFAVDLISGSVVTGFTSAAALVIVFSQLGSFLGVELVRSSQIFDLTVDLLHKLELINPYALALGLLTLFLSLLGRRVSPYFPGALLGAGVSALLVYWFNLEEKGVEVVGRVPSVAPPFEPPPLEPEAIRKMLGGALVLAFFGLIEAVAIAKTLAERAGDAWDPNRELIGQGAANLAVSFFKGFPVGGSFSRSSLSFTLRAKSPLANVFSGLVVGSVLFFASSAFYYVPKSSLAAVVLSSAASFFRPQEMWRLYKINRLDGWVAGLTFLSVFFAELWFAVTLGVLLSLGGFLYLSTLPRVEVLTRDPKTRTFVSVYDTPLPECPQILILKLNAPLYFGNAQPFFETVTRKVKLELARGRPLKFVLIDLDALTYTDATGALTLVRLIRELESTGVRCAFANLRCEVYETLERAGFADAADPSLVFHSKGEAVKELFKLLDHEYCALRCPYEVFDECKEVKKRA